MRIVPIPCLKDNYAYLVVSEGGEAAIVDASEAEPVRAAVRGYARADARLALSSARTPRVHARVLRARIHRLQPAVRRARRAIERGGGSGAGSRDQAARRRQAYRRNDARRRTPNESL